MSKKLNKLRSRKEFAEPFIRARLSLELLDEIGSWANERNTLVHHLARTPYNDKRIKQVALDGKTLVDQFRNKSKSINNHLERRQRFQ